MDNELFKWIAEQWHIIAPILIAALPSLGVVLAIGSNVKKLFTSNKSMVTKFIGEVKSTNQVAFNEILNQVEVFKEQFSREVNAIRSDNKIMSEIMAKVILSKAISPTIKQEIVLLANDLKNAELKAYISKVNVANNSVESEIKLAEVKPIEIVKEEVRSSYIPISE